MLSEKEIFCLSKYIQECAGISLSCETCRYVKDCHKNGFIQLETLIKLEKQTDLLLRKPKGNITITFNANVINKGIDNIVGNICGSMAKVSMQKAVDDN